jgi:hypothetical protein
VTICGLPDRHHGAAAAIGATLAWEATTMRYALLMHYREPGEGEISEEAVEEAKEAFGAYGRALESAGVLLSADVLQPGDTAGPGEEAHQGRRHPLPPS